MGFCEEAIAAAGFAIVFEGNRKEGLGTAGFFIELANFFFVLQEEARGVVLRREGRFAARGDGGEALHIAGEVEVHQRRWEEGISFVFFHHRQEVGEELQLYAAHDFFQGCRGFPGLVVEDGHVISFGVQAVDLAIQCEAAAFAIGQVKKEIFLQFFCIEMAPAAPFAELFQCLFEGFVEASRGVAGGGVGIESTEFHAGNDFFGNGFRQIEDFRVSGVAPLLPVFRQRGAEAIEAGVEVVAKVYGFRGAVVPLAEGEAVGEEILVRAGAVFLQSGDGGEEAAAGLEEFFCQLFREWQSGVVIGEAEKFFLEERLAFRLRHRPGGEGSPGGGSGGRAFAEHQREERECLRRIGEEGRVVPVRRGGEDFLFLREIAQLFHLGHQERRERLLPFVTGGRHGEVEGVGAAGHGEVHVELLLLHHLHQIISKEQLAVFCQLLLFYFREETGFLDALGEFAFDDAGDEDHFRFHGVAAVHAGDGDVVQGRRDGGVGERREAVFEEGEEGLWLHGFSAADVDDLV